MNAQQINSPKQLENKINEFEAFNEINFVNYFVKKKYIYFYIKRFIYFFSKRRN